MRESNIYVANDSTIFSSKKDLPNYKIKLEEKEVENKAKNDTLDSIKSKHEALL